MNTRADELWRLIRFTKDTPPGQITEWCKELNQILSQPQVECFECGTTRPISEMYEVEVYDTPWQDEPRTIYLCKCKPPLNEYGSYAEDCLELLYDHSWGDFRYFTCPLCAREICEQNPANGWHIQFRYLDDEQVCLRCYEAHILENGIDREEFEEGHISGMFFSGDNHEPLDAGYEVIREGVYINTKETVRQLCEQAIALIDSGHKVVIGYESMGIGGSEGYVTLFAKEEKDEPTN